MCVKSERQAAGWIQSSSLNFMARVKATKDMGPQKHVDGWLHIPSSFQLSSEHIHGKMSLKSNFKTLMILGHTLP